MTIKPENITRLYLSYLDLSPELSNTFTDSTHQIITNNLRLSFPDWVGFFYKYPDYSLGFIIVTKNGIEQLHIKGPSVSRKMKIVDFSIFLPNKIDTISEYIDCLFEGITLSLAKYKIDEAALCSIKEKCKKELGII